MIMGDYGSDYLPILAEKSDYNNQHMIIITKKTCIYKNTKKHFKNQSFPNFHHPKFRDHKKIPAGDLKNVPF